MFEPRPPVEHKKNIVKVRMPPYTGIAQYLNAFEKTPPPPRILFETPKERKLRIRAEIKKVNDEKLELLAADWDPHSNPFATE